MKASISAHLILSVAVISLAVFGPVGFFLLRELKSAQIEQVGEHGRQLAGTIRSSTRYAMLHNRRDDVEQIVASIGRQPAILDVRILNKEGRIVYSANRDQVGSVVDRDAPACYGCHNTPSPAEALAAGHGLRTFTDPEGAAILGVIDPIYNETSCAEAACHAHPPEQAVLGVLDVTMSLAAIEAQMRVSRTKALLLTAAAILSIGTVIGIFLHFRVAKPVMRLVQATRSVASGDLSYRADVRRNDEVGELERAFDEMTKQLAETQNQLYQSNKLASVGRLAAGIAHEINNPLTGILSFSSLLLESAKDGDADLREDLETIVRETKRCRKIVRGLLDFSRQVPPRKSRLDFGQIVQRALQIVQHELTVRDIRVTTALAEPAPEVEVDSDQMLQVLINLLVNAADAAAGAPGGGEVFVSTQVATGADGRDLEIKIADNGGGIPPEHLEKIFDPFFTTKEGRGSGLGLSVVWGIIREHGGTIEAHSRSGQGAVFTIRLPLPDEAARAA